uniref:Integrase catalytic domain-containing protein n=1 Tax=Schizaphis graminum TaxID=13262 RepID=A0A2S2PGT2_SCHGA
MGDSDRDVRAKDRAVLRRDSVVARIRHIHQLATRSVTDQAVRSQLVVAIQDLDALWSSFVVENSGVLDLLSELGLLAEFSVNLEAEIRALVVEAKALCNDCQPAPVVSVSAVQQVSYGGPIDSCSCSAGSSRDVIAPSVQRALVPARLPEIPLPYFDGDCQNWPSFRDRFNTLVAKDSNISNTVKFYYLLGCLHADPQEVVKGYTVSDDSFTLAWDALIERYDKPRMLASSIIDKLISAPIAASESHAALRAFLSVFDENIAILDSLQIPDLASFLLFSLAARCLPTSSRRLFESENNEDYSSVQSVIKFVRSRLQVLENAGARFSGSSSKPYTKPKPQGSRRDTKVAFVSATKPVQMKCHLCSGAHRLSDCSKFKAASVDDRYNTVCTHRLCMVCLREGHMSFKCPDSCSICKRRHHALLHRDAIVKKPAPPAALLGRQEAPTVLLGTALVHVRDTVGSFRTVRALIDSASQISAITSDCCDRLGLRPARWTVPVSGLSGQRVPDVQGLVQLVVQPRNSSSPSIQVKTWVLSSITSDMPARQLPSQVRAKCGNLFLADPMFDKPVPVELLIGADIFPQVWNDKSDSLGSGYPSVYSSIFGWVLIGPVQTHPDVGAQSMLVSLARLSPFLDSVGVVRVGGRMQNSNWSERRKHPMLIPKESHLAVLIVRHWHLYACHARPRLLIALVQQQFWIIGIRLLVHRVIRKCLICVKMSAANPQPMMADLPSFRVREAHPFSVVGIDYAGPLQMKELSLRKARIVKVYIAVFVCMTTKAVHLESVTALSTEAFRLTLDRFVARRGLPVSIYSDCGTNFVGAARQLRHLVNHPDSRDQLAGHVACEWHFNPPGAPHFGGIWEAAVKSAKSLLLRAMSSQVWTLEEFTSVLCRVEAAMNSRPLVPASPDPNDLECLTPGHFLVGRPLMSIPDPVETDTNIGLQTRWKLLQQSFQFFWRRWSREYLNTLQARGRWTKSKTNVEVGTMVIIKVNDTPPLTWPLGRIIEVHPGPDQVVRVAKVLTKQGVITRPVVKLVPLPTDP